MLQNISWSQYWFAIILICVIYYLIIWIVYFKASLSFLKHNAVSFDERFNSGTNTADMNIIVGDLEAAFENKKNKNELLLALMTKIKTYQEIDDPGFRDSINRFILSESLAKCSIRLEVDDLKTLWK